MSKAGALPEVNEARCGHCGLCVQVCRWHAVQLGDGGPQSSCPGTCAVAGIHVERGVYCLCEEACPNGAISWAFEIVMETSQGRGAVSAP